MLEITDHSVRLHPGCDLSGEARRCPPQALVDAALDWIDDPVGLLDERPVAVADLWRSLIETLVGGRRDEILVVHPADWPRHRVDRAVAAANSLADHVEAVSRDRWQREAVARDRWQGEVITPCRSRRGRPRRRLRPPAAALLAVSVVVAVAAVLVGRGGQVPTRPVDVTLVEGRMAVRVPARWVAERVTGGPGSSRLQVSSLENPGVAVHLTWSYAPEMTLEQAAAVLTRAIAAEPPGVFVDVRPRAEVGGRPAVVYRELRPGRVIVWAVIVAGATRISVGCQSPPGREADVRAACDEAVRSAREV